MNLFIACLAIDFVDGSKKSILYREFYSRPGHDDCEHIMGFSLAYDGNTGIAVMRNWVIIIIAKPRHAPAPY